MKSFYISTDVNGKSTYSIPFSDFINVHTLDAGIAETVTIPEGAKFILFSSSSDFYARVNGTASIPVNDVVDGSGSELNPVIRSLSGVDSLSVIAPFDCRLSMSFYS